MPYIQRDSSNKIIGQFANAQIGYADEFIAEGDERLTPALTLAELKEKVLAMIRTQRIPIFAALDVMRQDELIKIATSIDFAVVELAKTNARAIQSFIQGLRDITLIELTGTEAQMVTTVLLAHKALVSAAPTALKPQFKAALASK